MLKDFSGELRLRLAFKAHNYEDAAHHLAALAALFEEHWNRDSDREDPAASFITGTEVGYLVRVE